jgi:hypothetical protein
MIFTRSNSRPGATPLLGELPEFVRHVPRAESAAVTAVHYWLPERTGDPDQDYECGRRHFREAVAFSFRPNAQMFLAHVLVAMFQNLGPMESGFIDAMLEVAQVGAVPPKLTDEEVAAIAAAPERLRAIESEMAAAISSRGWLPDYLRLTLLRLLSGAEGELIGGAMTMIARTALNGSRN